MTDEQGLALHDNLHFAQVVAHECRTAADNVEDGIGQSYARTNLYASHDDMYIGLDALLLKKLIQDDGVGGGNGLVVEPFQALIVNLLGDGQRQSAAAKAQTLNDLGLGTFLHKFVFAHHTDIGYTSGHALGYIVIAQVKHLKREVFGFYQQRALAGTYFDVGLAEQLHGVIEQTAF